MYWYILRLVKTWNRWIQMPFVYDFPGDWYFLWPYTICNISWQWRHNGRDGVQNHQRLDCLLNCLFRHRSKKTLKHRAPVISPHKGPVTRKMSPFDDVRVSCRFVDTGNLLRGNIFEPMHCQCWLYTVYRLGMPNSCWQKWEEYSMASCKWNVKTRYRFPC